MIGKHSYPKQHPKLLFSSGDQQLESSQELQACISSSVASSGFYSGHSERDDPSPPHMGGSAPASFEFQVRSDAVLDTDSTSLLDSNISGKVGSDMCVCVGGGGAHVGRKT